MWSAQKEEQEGSAPPPPLYNQQAGYPQQQPPPPPPPQQQEHYPPPPQQQEYGDYSSDGHYYPDEHDEGALSSTINLVTSGVSALFRSQPPPPPPAESGTTAPPAQATTTNMPPPLQPESSMLSGNMSHSHASPASHSSQQQSYVPPPTKNTAPPPVAGGVYAAPPVAAPTGFSAPVAPPVAPAWNAAAAGPPPTNIPPGGVNAFAGGPPPTNVQQAPAAAPNMMMPVGATNAFASGPANDVAPSGVNAFASGPPPTNVEQTQVGMNAFAGAPSTNVQPVAASFASGPPPPPTNVVQMEQPAAAGAFPPPSTNPEVGAAFANPPPPINVQQAPVVEANDASNAFASAPPPTTNVEPPTTANASAGVADTSTLPFTENAPPTTETQPPVASSPMPSPVIATSLPSPSASSRGSSHGSSHRSHHHHGGQSSLLPPRSTTPVSASSPRPRYKLPPLSLPRPHASPKTSPSTRKWGGFKVPPPITTASSSTKKKSTIPGGITVKSATAAPSPMASPRLDTTTPSSSSDLVAPAPSPFVAPANVTPRVGEDENVSAEQQNTPDTLDMPQLDSVPLPPPLAVPTPVVEETTLPQQAPGDSAPPPPPPPQDNDKAPRILEEEEAKEPQAPPPPPMFVPAPSNGTPVESAPPVFTAAPPTQNNEEMTTALPSFVAAPPPDQVEETAPAPPVFNAAPPAAAPLEETSPPPASVAADAPPMAGAPPPPPNDFGAAVSPEDERPKLDQQSERSSSMEYPEETVAQNDVVEPEDEQHFQSVLPEPWSAEIDDASQRVYYYNSVTGETRWDRPAYEEDAETEEAPAVASEDETQVQELPPEQTYSQEEQVVGDEDTAEGGFVSQPPLPEGWTEEVDPASGVTYYYSLITGEASWERPVAEQTSPGQEAAVVEEDLPVAEESTLPDGWVEEIDEASGLPYYYHAASDVTTWERPSHEAAATEAADTDERESENVATVPDGGEAVAMQTEIEDTGPESAVREASVDGSESAMPLPDGWTEHFDPSSGKPYYVNSTENVTSWERPNIPQGSGAVDDSQPTDDGIAEPPSITRATDRSETDSLPESTAFATEEHAMAQEEIEPAQMDDSAAAADTMSPSNTAAAEDNLDKARAESELEGTDALGGDLPEEWEELVDQDSGRVYYYNTVDGTTSWDRPMTTTRAQSQSSSDSEPERTSETEPSTNAPPKSAESWNLVSSQGSFDAVGDQGHDSSNPEEQVESANSPAAASDEPTETETAAPADVRGLPPDWRELIDPSTGNAYYLNEVTNETTWERPVTGAVETEETSATEAAMPPTESEQPTSEAFMPTESTDTTELTGKDGFKSDGLALGAVSMEVNVNESRDEGEIEPTAEQDTLPEGWTELFDEASGMPYYLNEADGTTTWERPVGITGLEPRVDETAGEEETALETQPAATNDDTPVDERVPAVENETEQDFSPVHSESTSSEALPTGWTEMTDPSSGRPYYVNETENITTWDKPVASTSDTDDVKAVPEEPGDVSESKPEAEEKDAALVQEEDIAPNDQKVDVADSEGKSEPTLPAGWVEMTDPASGKPYYFNEDENVTTWDRPQPIAVEEPPTVEASASLQENAPEDIADGYTMVEHSETASKEEPSSDEQADLPPGWVELVDESSGDSYFLNEAENITTWDRPTAAAGTTKEVATESSANKPQDAKDASVEESPLLEGWSEIVDPGTKHTYYFNEETGETTWSRPSAPVVSAIPGGASKAETKSDHPPARVFATFGFGGKLCVWESKAPSTVAVYRTGYLLKDDPVVLAEQKKKESKVIGPLNSCEEGAVLKHIDSKAHFTPANETARIDLLWSLALIAAKSNGRLRSDDGVRNPTSPEAGIISLLLDESSELNDSASLSTDATDYQHDDGMKGEVASLSSLKKVEKLLLWGKREEAVQEAISSNNFAMALLVASMCDRSTFQDATRQFADEILSTGSPLHTLAMLFSGQLQPPTDSALDRTGSKPSIWDDESQNLAYTWRQHLAATISNRTLGWDRIVLALGDNLLESGHVHAAHFCYMACGCPVSSLLHPSSRMCLVGCDHVVKMDAALMTPEGIAGYERTEAYEWAKRRGNPTAAIPSLQPFKLMYAMLLADMGLEADALLYVESIRQCCGLEGLTEGYTAARVPSTVWALSVKGELKDSLNEFEDRLCQGKYLSRTMLPSDSGGGKSSGDSDTGPFASPNVPPFQPAAIAKEKKKVVKRMRPKNKSPRRTSVGSMDTVSEDEAYPETDGHRDEDMNATFLSAQSNLLDVTAPSTGDKVSSAGPPTMQPASAPGGDRHQTFLETASREEKLDPRALTAAAATPSDAGAPPMMMPPIAQTKPAPSKPEVKEDAAKKEQAKKNIKHPPFSAPAVLGAKKDKSMGGSPHKGPAPSSDKKGKSFFGLKEKLSKWRNPDATTADLGEGMKAYFDEDRKVWVFPGDDPDEVAKPIGPPPTIPKATPEPKDEPAPATPADPLAAMMAPPSRQSLIRRSSSTMSTMEKAAPHHYPGMLGGPPGSANRATSAGAGPPPMGGPPPQFTVFKPAPAPVAKEGEEANE